MKAKLLKKLKSLPVDEAPAEKPTKTPELPAFPPLTGLSSYELGEYFHNYTSYLGYINQMMAEAKFQEKNVRLRLKRLRARALMEAKGAFKAKHFAQVRCRKDVQELENELLVAQGITGGWNQVFWTVKGYMDAAKFEMERRRSDRD